MENNLKTATAKAIKSIRLSKNLSQEDLASLCELDRTYISGLERQVRNPTVNTIQKIIDSVGVSERDFLRIVLEKLSEQ